MIRIRECKLSGDEVGYSRQTDKEDEAAFIRGGFMLVHTKAADKVITFRERAPASATRDMYKADPTLSKIVSALFTAIQYS